MDNREGTIVSIITNTNNRFTCHAKKVCINLTNTTYACLIYLPRTDLHHNYVPVYHLYVHMYFQIQLGAYRNLLAVSYSLDKSMCRAVLKHVLQVKAIEKTW